MGITSLKENAKVTRVMNRGAGAASPTPTKGAIIDMHGYESVMFVASMQDVLDTSAVALRVAGGEVSDTAQVVLLAGSAGGTAGASDFDNKLLILDVEKPTQRYLEAQLFHVTANAPFDSVIAIQYGARSTPVMQGSTVKAATTLVSPATV